MVHQGDEIVIFDCDCGSEALELSAIDLEEVGTVYLSIWERGYGRNKTMGLWDCGNACALRATYCGPVAITGIKYV